MDRLILVSMALGVGLLAGCNRSKSPDASATPPGSAAATGSDQGSGARKVGQPSPKPPSSFQPPSASPVPALDATNRSNTAYTFPDDVIEGNLERPPPAAEMGLNPLRGLDEPMEPSLPSDNPLRAFRGAPRMAMDAPPPKPEAPPEVAAGAPPAGGWMPPDVTGAAKAARDAANEAAALREYGERVAAEAAAGAKAFARGESGAREAIAKASLLPPLLSSPPESDEYDVVQVFYGTDRLAAESPADNLLGRIMRFLPTGCSLLVTLCLALPAAGRRSSLLWLLVIGGGSVSLGLGYQASAKTLTAIRRSEKEVLHYTTGRSPDGRVDLGLCEVTLPKTHEVGELEAPSILRLEVREDAARHVVLRKTERVAGERFYDLLRQRVAASPQKELFVFVHGFNVSFEDAARRTAQIHFDLKFAGAPVFFSWPAHDKFMLTYAADETNIAWSAPHLKQFLLEITRESQARSINLIAHSMGNRALTAALREIELELRDRARLFNQVVLAAPDIDADDFRHNIAPAMRGTAQRLTLYASSRDDALLASQLLHRRPRAGDAGEGLVVIPGIDTIDVTAIDSSPWGHIYYGSSNPVLQDLKLLFTRSAAPRDRSWLSPAERNGLTYWIFQPERTATSSSTLPR